MRRSPGRTAAALLRPAAAAAYLGISRTTFYELAKQGHLKLVRISDRISGIRKADLDAYLASLGPVPRRSKGGRDV